MKTSSTFERKSICCKYRQFYQLGFSVQIMQVLYPRCRLNNPQRRERPMFQHSARALFKTHYMVVALCLVSSLRPAIAEADSQPLPDQTLPHQTIIKKDFRCKSLSANDSLCSTKIELQNINYENRFPISQDFIFSAQSDSSPPQADLMTIFKLALEEFDLLPGMRIYWEYTARRLESWAFKLKLKGELSPSEPYHHIGIKSQKDPKQPERTALVKQYNSNALISILTPQKIKWNIRMDPGDLNVSGDVHINSYLSLNARLGNESQVGLFIRYAF